VKVVENLREQIIALGGEIRFEQRVTDVIVEGTGANRHLRGLKVLNQATGETTELRADQVVMAPGHGSRDTFARLHQRGVAIEVSTAFKEHLGQAYGAEGLRAGQFHPLAGSVLQRKLDLGRGGWHQGGRGRGAQPAGRTGLSAVFRR